MTFTGRWMTLFFVFAVLAAAGCQKKGVELYNFQDHIDSASSVLVVSPSTGDSRLAYFSDGAWVFDGLAPWHNVAKSEELINGETLNCIWFHPLSGYTKLIRFTDVLLGSELRIKAGIADSGREYVPAPDVNFRVDVIGKSGGQAEGVFQINGSEESLDYSVDLSPISDKKGDVSFTVTTSDDNFRHFCFQAESVS